MNLVPKLCIESTENADLDEYIDHFDQGVLLVVVLATATRNYCLPLPRGEQLCSAGFSRA